MTQCDIGDNLKPGSIGGGLPGGALKLPEEIGYNRRMDTSPVKLLTIAGSDSGGAAGLQADLRAWGALGAYGMSVITAVTAQNSRAVLGVEFLSPEFVGAQMAAVMSDYGADAAKTGFLGRVEIITAVAAGLRRFAVPHLVVDPVLVNHKGQAMFDTAVTAAYLSHLFPLADLITPNIAEAGLLLHMEIRCLQDGETAVRRLHDLGPRHVLLKRIPAGKRFVDLFYNGREVQRLAATKVHTGNTHGAGDVLSAAVAAFLGMGLAMDTAVSQAHHFTQAALQHSASWQLGGGHGPVYPPPAGSLAFS